MKRPKGVNGHQLLKEQLELFWCQFGGSKCNGDGMPQKDKMSELKRMAAIVIPYRKQQPTSARRDQFNEIKHSMHKMKVFWKCFVCGTAAKSRHHIIQLQNGGINSRKNVVSLCDPCHAEIHPWLT